MINHLGEISIKSKATLLALIILLFITISCVNAADNQTTETLTIEQDLETPELSSEETGQTLDFTQLNNTISTATEKQIKLENDYTYNSTTDTGLGDGIVIDRDNLVIDGDNHIIDASNQARVFTITASNVTLKNINFINGHDDTRHEDGNIIRFEKYGTVENCTFKNNHAAGYGTLYFENGNVIGSTFINNFAELGGAIFFNRNGNVSSSNFISNSAGQGGAIYTDGRLNLEGSNFTGNHAGKLGGAIFTSTGNIKGTDIIGGSSIYGGAIYAMSDLIVENSNFTANNASEYGGALYSMNGLLSIENSNFNDNNALIKDDNVHIYNYVALISINNTPKTLTTLSFKALAKQISEFTGDILVLCENYEYNPSRDADYVNGIIIDKDNLTIDGDGITIDAVNQARVFNITASNVTLKNINFINGYSEYEGGAIIADIPEGILTIENCSFTGGNSGYGSAVSITGEAKIINSQFTGNTADMGGAIDLDYGVIDNCIFTGNHAGNGGAVIVWNDSTIKNSIFTENTAVKFGGAVYAFKDNQITLTFENNTFKDNSADEGGAVSINTGIIDNCEFTNNTAEYGGAVLIWDDTIVKNSNFTRNTANYYYGGALYSYVYGHFTVTVENTTFTGNTASFGGGAIFANDELNVYASNFNNNSAADVGGALYAINVTVENSNFTRNNADKSGGAIYALGANVKDSDFNSNKINYDGGAILILSYNSTIENTSFTNNHAGRYGGAIYVSKNELKVANSTFKGNTAPDESYNIHLQDSATLISENNTPEKLIIYSFKSLAEKISTFTGDILVLTDDYLYNPLSDSDYVNGVEIRKDNLTIDGAGHTLDGANQARILNVLAYNVTIKNINFINGNSHFGGASIFLGGGGDVMNCNFTNNNAFQGGAIDSNGKTTISDCNFMNNSAQYGGAVNINGNGTITNSTFIDNTAIQRGGAVDIKTGTVEGCEFISNAAENNGGALNVRQNTTVKNTDFTGNSAEYGGAIYMANYTLNVENTTFKDNTANGKTYNIYTREDSTLITSNTTPEYLMPQSFKTLSDLISNCTGNMLVLDIDFFFNPSTDSDLTDGVVIGKDNFILDGQGHTLDGMGQTRILGVSGDNVTIKNINFINGRTVDYYNGAAIYFNRIGSVENCSFKNNTADNEGGAIYFTDFATVTDSTFEDNHALRWGGAVYFEQGGMIDNSQFTNNIADIYAGAVYFTGNGTVKNSNFTKNRAAKQGGAVSFRTNGTVENSIFTANHAGTDGGAVFVNHNAVISNAEFINNTANEQGGAIFAYHGTLDIADIIFEGNSAGDYSSNVYLDVGMNFTYDNVTPEDFLTLNLNSLAHAIKNCESNTLTLTGDYIYDPKTDGDYVYGVFIDRDNFIIDGAGHTIDGLKTARIFTINSNNVTFKNINFINGYSDRGAGVIHGNVLKGDYIVDACNFTNNTGVYGGAICIDAWGSILINNSIFTNNTGNNGGAINIMYGTITNSEFTNNHASVCGAVNIYSGSVDNCAFTDCSSGDSGAIYFWNNGIITNSVFTRNDGATGGAVYFEGNGTVKNSNFTDNTAKLYPSKGGAVYFEQTGIVENSTFTNNEASTGGAVYMANSGHISDSTFTDNKAVEGGAVYMSGDVTVSDTRFTNNSATSYGGAIHAVNGEIELENIIFADNSARAYTENILADETVNIVFTNITPEDFLTRNFKTLGRQIENAKDNILVLDCDYAHYATSSYGDITVIPVAIDNLVIDGAGHTIDALGLAGIFKITGANVTLKNINFINANYEYYGAVYSDVDGLMLVVDNCNFTNNKGVGGAITTSGKLVVNNSNFNSDNGTYGGAINAHDLYVMNSKFTHNHALTSGGAIYAYNANITDCEFTGNTALDGGAIYIQHNGSVENSSFENNTATRHGGAVTFNIMGSVKNTIFTNNNATGNGGAVYINIGEVSDCEFINNDASTGGAINIDRGSVSDSNFTANHANDGGAVFFSGEGLVSNGRFTDNAAANNGGAVKFNSNGTVTDSIFNNSRAERGGAIHVGLGHAMIEKSSFTNNTATSNGGSAVFLSDYGTIDECNFTANHDAQYGGAVYISSYDGIVKNSRFTNNTASELGGAIYFARSGNVEDSVFISNSVTGDKSVVAGGAVWFGENGVVLNSEFMKNNASRYGGAVFFYLNGTVENSNFTDNMAKEGGALFMKNGGEINNATFTLNNANDGGAISTSGALTISNSVFTDNVAVGGTHNVLLKDNANISLRNVTPEDLSPYYPIIMELISVTNITYGEIVNITVSVKDSHGNPMNTGNVSVTIKNQNYTTNVSDGKAIISIPDLNAGEYDVDVTYHGEHDFAIPFLDVSFNVARLPSHLEIVEVTNNESYYGSIISIKANVTSNGAAITDGFLQISVNGGNYSSEVIGGVATIMLNSVDVGEYDENVTYMGTNYENQIAKVTFKVLKSQAEIAVTVTDIKYGDTVKINVNVTSNNTFVDEGNVSIVIGGRTYSANVINQMATIEIPGLDAGSYKGNVTYNSDNFYNPVENVTFNVAKQDTVITASAKTYVINYGGKYSITLKDSAGRLLSGQKVIFTLNGKNIGSAITDAKGVATITLTAKMLKTAKAGKRNLNIKFDATGNFNPTSKTVKITVNKEKTKITAKKKTFKKSKKVKKYTIKLKNSKGKAVKKVKVYIKIKGKTYKAKTNSKGKATFKIKKLTKKGTYKSKITFKGNKYYLKAKKTVKIKIK